ncbi:MAG: hypothetical protein ACFB10_11300 [Salibacteraceae bacterium]
MALHYKIIGTLLMVLALAHGIFPRYFNWKEELQPLSLINRQMMEVHTFFVALVVFLMGLLCFIEAYALVETALGKTISVGMAIFWTARLFVQFFWYAAKLWKGKALETSIHVLFSLLWFYVSIVCWANALEAL